MIFSHIRIQGKALRTNGVTYSSRINLGNRSVGEIEVKIKALANKTIFKTFFSLVINHIAIPAIAMMKVGDSAL
jgi:hypothetical protein